MRFTTMVRTHLGLGKDAPLGRGPAAWRAKATDAQLRVLPRGLRMEHCSGTGLWLYIAGKPFSRFSVRSLGEWRCFMKSRKCSERIRSQFESAGCMAAQKGRAQVAQRVEV
jgi:hypothetical protein